MNRYLGQSFSPQEITARRQELERIELFKGRPDRNHIINSEDICNLLIALHKTEDVSDFLERI